MRLKAYLLGLLLLPATLVVAQAQGGEWKRYELGKGHFSVLLPGQPKEAIDTAPPSASVPIDSYVYAIATEEGSFVAQYSLLGEVAEKWNESAQEHFLAGVWEGAAAGFNKEAEKVKVPFKVTLVEKRQIRFSGYPGREVVFTFGPYQGRLWVTIVGRKSFVAVGLVPENAIASQQKFLNSFTITLNPPEQLPAKPGNQ